MGGFDGTLQTARLGRLVHTDNIFAYICAPAGQFAFFVKDNLTGRGFYHTQQLFFYFSGSARYTFSKG
jgi:hypothetical protein